MNDCPSNPAVRGSSPPNVTLSASPARGESISDVSIPTKSETFAAETLKVIIAECKAIKAGELDAEDNPLRMAPHTADEVCADEWKHSYSRTQAAFPLDWIRENKLWPAVSRVDNGYGDRNLVTNVE